MKNKNKFNQGFSLIEIMVAIGLSGFLVIIMTQLNEQGIKTTKTMEAKFDKRLWLQSLTNIHIKTSEVCIKNFGPAPEGLNGIASTAVANNINVLFDKDDNRIIDILAGNNLLPSRAYRVSLITMQPFVPNEAGSSEGICPIDVRFEAVDNSATGASKIFGSTHITERLNLSCAVDKSIIGEPLTNCVPVQGDNLNSLWNMSFIGTEDFINWNATNANGSVIIGSLSQNPLIQDTASLNINLSGMQWSADANFNFNEGVTLQQDNAIHWNDLWYIYLRSGVNNLGFGRIAAGPSFVNSLTLRNEYASDFLNGIIVNGDLTITNEEAGNTYAMGLHHEGTLQYISWNRLQRDSNQASGTYLDLNYTNEVGPSALMQFDTTMGEMSLYQFNNTFTGTITQATVDANKILSFYYDNRYLFGDDNSMQSVGSNYSMALGNTLIQNGPHAFNIGANSVQNCFHCFNLGLNNLVGDIGAGEEGNYTMVIGNNNVVKNVANLIMGKDNVSDSDFSMIIGEDNYSNPDSHFSFLSGLNLETINPYEIAFGAKNISASNGEDFTRWTYGDGATNLGNLFTFTNASNIRLRTYNPRYDTLGAGTPGDLFILAPYDTDENWDSSLMITSNLNRECGGGTCTYIHYGANPATGHSGIALSDISGEINFFTRRGSGGSANRTSTSAVSKATLSNETMMTLSPTTGITVYNFHRFPGDVVGVNTVTATSTWSPSDQRLKENIEDYNPKDFLTNFLKLNPVSFQYIERKNKDQVQYGFIAQELLTSFPEIVVTKKDGFYGVKQNVFSVLLIKVIQIMDEFINKIEIKLTEFEERIKNFEKNINSIKDDNLKLINYYCKHSLKKDLKECH